MTRGPLLLYVSVSVLSICLSCAFCTQTQHFLVIPTTVSPHTETAAAKADSSEKSEDSPDYVDSSASEDEAETEGSVGRQQWGGVLSLFLTL